MAFNAYQAYGKGHGSRVAPTAREAAERFFADFPKARKCNVTQGEDKGDHFIVAYSPGAWPQSFKDVTRKSILELPA